MSEAGQGVGTACAKALVWRPLEDRKKSQGRWNRVNKSRDTFMMKLELGGRGLWAARLPQLLRRKAREWRKEGKLEKD